MVITTNGSVCSMKMDQTQVEIDWFQYQMQINKGQVPKEKAISYESKPKLIQ